MEKTSKTIKRLANIISIIKGILFLPIAFVKIVWIRFCFLKREIPYYWERREVFLSQKLRQDITESILIGITVMLIVGALGGLLYLANLFLSLR